MPLKVGSRLKSAVCTTEVMVVRAPADDVALTCGGAPMTAPGEEGGGATLDPEQAGGAQLGKRYADEDLGLEVLVTKAGDGTLCVNGAVLELKGAKGLPASD
ncbi:MAG: hypothetical protein AB7O29_09495 [Acidimicrobiia bacterium]